MLIELQNVILKMVAQGDELEEALTTLCLEVEHLLPGALASVLTLDDHGLLHPRAAPNLPKAFSNSIDTLQIGPMVGSCGSAAFLGEVVTVSDIEHDPRWVEFRHLAVPLGLRACFSSPIFGSKGKVLGTFALYFQVARSPTELEQSIVEGCLPLCMIALERNERLLEHRRLAFTDVLTGLSNRAKFNDVLEQEMRGRWSLLLVDIDNLKTVNDTFGHATGDELISSVASILSLTVAPLIAYRLGGDEFAVILDSASTDVVENIASRVLVAIGNPIVCNGHTVFPTATIGAAKCGLEKATVGAVRHNADLALYHAKDINRGGFILHDATVESTIFRRHEAIRSVAAALKEDRIEAWYQPIVRLDTEEIVGVEALARMRAPDGRIIPASHFHEATKDAQVAAALTRQMVSRIASDVGGWLKAGLTIQHVGINISAADFQYNDLPGILESAFEKEGVPLHHAILEVTESVYLSGRNQSVAKKIAELRAAGLKIALDDFGTGFASLTHLITVPVDIIKIDRSFVERLGPNDVGTAIVEGILHIANRLGIRVVAEGIETNQHADLLYERGCLLGQGYLYSKAVPAAEMARLLMDRAQHGDKIALLDETLLHFSDRLKLRR